jgi:probable F420-dependent oxidoreductase
MNMKKRPFRFGVLMLGASSRQAWITKVKRVEELGYGTLALGDHPGMPIFSPLIALMQAAEVSSTLRLGTKVLNVTLRPPVLLAKELATLDLLSSGRVEIGLGAGVLSQEDKAAGLPSDAPGVRVEKLEETIHLLKGLLGDGPVSFSGRHATVNLRENLPKPVQRPHPPLLLSCSGKRMLALAAREADSIVLNPRVSADTNGMDMQDATEEATARKIAVIREAAGERFAQIELGVVLAGGVGRTDGKQQQEAAISPVLDSQRVNDPRIQGIYRLAGSVDQICEQVLANRERLGISYLTVFEPDLEAFAPIVARLSGQ